SIRLDRLLWDAWAPGLHLTNVVVHAAATALAAGCALLLTGVASTAFLTGLLFAVHPVHVEAVASIENRKELLAFVFVAAALLLRCRRPRRAVSSSGALAALVLAFGAKDVAAAGAAVMLAAADLVRDDAESSRMHLVPWVLGPLVIAGAATLWYAGDLPA